MKINGTKFSRNCLGNTLKKTFDNDYFKEIFRHNESLADYGKEIIDNLFNMEEEYMTTIYLEENIRKEYLLNIYKIVTRTNFEKIKFYDNIFFLLIKISDKLIYMLRYEINEKSLELIYYISFCIAYKFETGKIISFSTFDKYRDGSLIEKDALREYEKTINELLNYNYLIAYPDDFLQIYENIENTQSNKTLDNLSKLMIKFALFTKSFIEKKTSLITLTAYYFAKLKLKKKFKWSYHIQLVTGYDQEIIKENIIELIYEIRVNEDIFKKLLNNDF